LYPSGIPKTAVVTTPSGKQFKGDLVHVDPFRIAITDSAGWYHSWSCSEVKFQIHDPLAAHQELLPRYTEARMHDMFAYLETLK
jgi:cytochrome c oxidase cbb3-type subunit 3